VSGGLNRLLAAAIVAGTLLIALIAPSVASASCNGRPSAANVYKECLAGGGGGKHTGSGKTTGPGSSNSTPTVVHTSPQIAKALKQAGKQRRVLSALVRGYGVKRLAQPTESSHEASSPTAIGSAFDVGSGPTALLLVLAGTAVVLLGGSGMRAWRARHRS
jgi:hypothetical protein